MKKIILALSVLSLISCNEGQEIPYKDFSHKGHHYISWNGFDVAGIVHDPDCPCHLDTLGIYVFEKNDTCYVIKEK